MRALGLNEILGVHAGAKRYIPMEGLRAYAAFLVFLVHFADNYSVKIVGAAIGDHPPALSFGVRECLLWYFYRSHYGVEIFFFLSGFLIQRMLARGDGSLAGFLAARFFRIYPAFLLTFLVILVSGCLTGRHEFDISRLVSNLMFLNAFPETGVKPYSAVTWSLGFEFLFYFIFPVLLIATGGLRQVSPVRILFLGLGVWVLLAFLLPGYMRFLMFFGGALMAAYGEDQLRRQAGRLTDAVALLIYVAAGLVFSLTSDLRVFVPIFLVATYFLVLRCLYGGGWLAAFFSLKPLRIFGNLSYSFYLVHASVIAFVVWDVGFVFNWLNKMPVIGGAAYLVATMVSAVAVSLAVATLVFLIAERPYFSRRNSAKVARPAGA